LAIFGKKICLSQIDKDSDLPRRNRAGGMEISILISVVRNFWAVFLYRYHSFIFAGRVADPDSGSGGFSTPGSGIRNVFFRIRDG